MFMATAPPREEPATTSGGCGSSGDNGSVEVVVIQPGIDHFVAVIFQVRFLPPRNRMPAVEEQDLYGVTSPPQKKIPQAFASSAPQNRPHSAREHLAAGFHLTSPEQCGTVCFNDIVCTSKPGGVINSDSRRAA
jgi:hypothetical protein